MPQIRANGLMLNYDLVGAPDGDPLLLIMGLGAQMTRWPKVLRDGLAAKGFRVIWFDNRDVGLSEKLEAAGAPDLAAVMGSIMKGEKPSVPYTLHDMAADAVGLLDALGVDKAHIVGASMGGMIAQLVAADYPERVKSLTSIMSTTGNPSLSPASPAAQAVLGTRAPDPKDDLEAFLAHSVKSARAIGSPGYPAEEATLRAQAQTDAERSYYPVGFGRQYAAILVTGDRRAKLAKITAPTMVIHGEDDPLVPVDGGRDTAANIKNAQLITIPGMGHDLPAALTDTVIDGILKVAKP